MSVVQPGTFVPAPDAKTPRRARRPRESDAPPRRYTEEEMLEALREYAREHEGRSPSQRAYDAWRRDALPSCNNFPRRFGSWTAALEAAGLVPSRRPREQYAARSDAEMLATLLRFLEEDVPTGAAAWGARRFDTWVAENEIDAAKSATYIFRFGTWRNARRLAREGIDR